MNPATSADKKEEVPNWKHDLYTTPRKAERGLPTTLCKQVQQADANKKSPSQTKTTLYTIYEKFLHKTLQAYIPFWIHQQSTMENADAHSPRPSFTQRDNCDAITNEKAMVNTYQNL